MLESMEGVAAAPRLEAWLYYRNELRAACARAHEDAEDFHELLFAVERLGGYLLAESSSVRGKSPPDVRGMRDYRHVLKILAAKSGIPTGMSFDLLFDLVCDARNDALHVGAFARHLTEHALLLAHVLGDALMDDAILVEHYMVREPVRAETWQPLSAIRYAMLAHSFSFLPVWHRGEWRLLSDEELARFVGRGAGRRKQLLKYTVERALAAKGPRLEAEPAEMVEPHQKVGELLKKPNSHRPWLVVEGGNLVGILTAYDLL
jgi:predicted transcriptional regulator